MIRFSRVLAVSVFVAATAALTASMAADQMIAVNVPTSPPKEYVIPKKGVSDAIRKAVENPARRPEDRARDGYRRPAEVLALTGIRPGNKVAELGSFGELDKFGQYYTTILADVVGPKGMVYMYDTLDIDEQFGANSRIFAAANANTKYEAVNFEKIQFPRNLDMAVSVLFYHEMLMRGVDMTVFHDKLFKALRPGGYYLVVDHAGTIGEDIKKTIPLHRLDPSYIRQGVTAAGFEQPIESRLLERRDDDHKWPVSTEGKADQTDQTVYLFRKPVVY
jgi:predicted methyltransferase